ncbi:hypothetical protein [Microbulbifer agarilyticus]
MFERILAISLCFISYSVSASTIGVVGQVQLLTNYEGHQGTIFTIYDMSKLEGACERSDYFILPLEHKYFDQNYSLLLSAKVAEREVRIMFEIGDCVDSLPRVKHLSLM